MPETKLEIYYPFKPFITTQRWGNPNPTYANQFNNPAFKLHNGVDANTGRLDWQGKVKTDYLVYCPVRDFVVDYVGNQPNGGGKEVGFRSKTPLKMFDKECYAWLIMCHAKKILVPAGYEPKLGELIMIADNTGFSTGLHTHIGLYRLDAHGNKVDQNEAVGSFDPTLFFTNKYAVDEATTNTLIISVLRYLAYLTGAV